MMMVTTESTQPKDGAPKRKRRRENEHKQVGGGLARELGTNAPGSNSAATNDDVAMESVSEPDKKGKKAGGVGSKDCAASCKGYGTAARQGRRSAATSNAGSPLSTVIYPKPDKIKERDKGCAAEAAAVGTSVGGGKLLMLEEDRSWMRPQRKKPRLTTVDGSFRSSTKSVYRLLIKENELLEKDLEVLRATLRNYEEQLVCLGSTAQEGEPNHDVNQKMKAEVNRGDDFHRHQETKQKEIAELKRKVGMLKREIGKQERIQILVRWRIKKKNRIRDAPHWSKLLETSTEPPSLEEYIYPTAVKQLPKVYRDGSRRRRVFKTH